MGQSSVGALTPQYYSEDRYSNKTIVECCKKKRKEKKKKTSTTLPIRIEKKGTRTRIG
jgi:predicted HicB family RNase H-like nuclease